MERKTGNCYGEKRNYQEDMSSWRLEECPPFADSYIEWRFEKKCREYRDGVYILTEWRDRKKQFISYLNASVFDFQHYSRHDESHALNILESIEMLLGQERIDLLSIGDLWLLLECAYSHDMSMSYTYTELNALWESKEFKDYIHSCDERVENKNDARVLYRVIDNLLHGRERFDDLEHYLEKHGEPEIGRNWPLQLERGIQAIVADYARREHAKRLTEAISKLDEKKMPEVPIRLYKVMVNACVLHGKEFEDIFEDVHYCEKGFGNSSLHPQFAAAMLRIGDLLDLDNNRFNERAREHYGEFPNLSLLHYKKHKAIVHFAVKTSGIEVEASSDDQEVCKVVADWFRMLDSEVEKLICNWNKIVPAELKGCLLNTCESKIYLENEDGKSFFTAREDANFQIDKQKMIKLLMGENIYNSHIDFIREYLQNALDASKMRLWVDIKNERLRYSDCFWGNNKKETLTPFDIGMTIYEQYAIEVFVDTDMERQKIILKFKDVGIGIEEECVKVISNVGGGWRRREKYKDDLETMPRWLRPTGGFGIGVQSAFMVSDQVEIVTKGLHEKDGRKLTLQNPKGDGKIVSEVAKGAEEGTAVKVELDYFYFNDVRSEIENISDKNMTDRTEDEAYKSQKNLSNSYFSGYEYFDKEKINRFVVDFLENYIRVYFSGTMIPIRIIYTEQGRKYIRKISNQRFPRIDELKREDELIQAEFTADGKRYLAFYIPDKNKNGRKIFWNLDDEIFAEIVYTPERRENEKKKERQEGLNYVCFKNAKVNREKSVTDSYAKDYDIFIDYEGFYAEQILKIHREDFAPEFETKRYTRGFLDVYFQFLHYLYNNKKKELEEEGSFLKKEMFDIIPQLLQLVYLNKTLDWTQEYEQEYTGKDSVEVIEWKYKEDETCTTFKAASRDRDEILKQIYDVMDNNGKCIAIRVAESSEIERGETAVIKPDLVKDWRSIRTIKCLKDEAVAHTKELMEAYSGESCTQNIIQSIGRDMMDWAEEKDRELKESRRSMESFSGFWNILNDFSDAAYAIADTSIAELLEKYEKFEKRYFSFYGNETLLALLYMSNPRKMLDDEGFCRVSYDRENYEKPFVSGEDAKRYEILLVSGLPYEEGDKRNKNDQYLISPINLRIFKEIEKKKAVVLEKADKNKNTTVEIFPYERFRDLIMSDESFGALKKWVYHKQPVKGKYNLYQIHEEYEKYIHEIYNWWTKYGDNI